MAKPSWVTLDKSSGTGGGSVKVTASENTGNFRYGALTIKTASGLTKTISVQQDLAPCIIHFRGSFSVNDFSVDGSATLDSVSVKFNTSDGGLITAFTCLPTGSGLNVEGSGEYDEGSSLYIDNITIAVSGNSGAESDVSFEINGEPVELESPFFPIYLRQTYYGDTQMVLSGVFENY